MAKNSIRTGVVLVLLLGTLALAVPYVSTAVDSWLFSEGPEPARQQWNTQRPAGDKTLKPANPHLVPPGKQLSHDALPDDGRSAPLAFEFEDQRIRPEVSPVEHLEPAGGMDDAGSLAQLKQEIEALGAVYLIVESAGDRFECRTLFPLSPQSSYQKAFSATGSTPQAAMEQVLAEVSNWQRARRK
jgi:hypothetical protein